MKPLIAVPAIAALVYRAWSHRSLTPAGISAAIVTAVAHAVHPWAVCFALLVVFFLGGTTATKVKKDVKARLTLSSVGASGGEGARTHIQVLANSLVASVLILAHVWFLGSSPARSGEQCFAKGASLGDLLIVGIVSNYAAVSADTFSSELGILAGSNPRLITSINLREVPPGTNGGVSLFGVMAGFLGASLIGVASAVLLPFCAEWTPLDIVQWVVAVTVWGGLGSLLDSFLGGWLQASVVDRRTGKVVEGPGGRSVPYRAETSDTKTKDTAAASRYLVAGTEWLDNNGVNLLMAALMSVGGMAVANTLWKPTWQ